MIKQLKYSLNLIAKKYFNYFSFFFFVKTTSDKIISKKKNSLIPRLFISTFFSLILIPQFTYSQNYSSPLEQLVTDSFQLDEAQMNKAIDLYVQNLPSVTTESLQNIKLFKEAMEFAQAKLQEMRVLSDNDVAAADELFRKEIDQRKLIYVSEELGTAEFTNIDNSTVIRLIDKIGTVILFVHAQYVKKDSSHLIKYLSRQHSIAGKNGRNVIIVWHDDNQLLSSEEHLKPSVLKYSYWQGYLSAVYKPATFDSLCFGIISGLAQASLTGIMGFIQHGFTPSLAIISASVLGFGSFVGTYASTYRNIVFFSNSKVSQILKQSVVSFAFAYMLFSLNQVAFGEANHIVSFSEYIGLLMNILLSSSAKNEFSQWAKIKDMERADIKNYTATVPILNRDFTFTERDINYQLKVQLTTQSIRTADLLGYQLTIPTSSGVYTLDLGKILLWLSAPIVHFSVKKWANKNYPETAKKLDLDKEVKQVFKDFLKRTFTQIFINPFKWKSALTTNIVNRHINEIDLNYVDAKSKSITYKNTSKLAQQNKPRMPLVKCSDIFSVQSTLLNLNLYANP